MPRFYRPQLGPSASLLLGADQWQPNSGLELMLQQIASASDDTPPKAATPYSRHPNPPQGDPFDVPTARTCAGTGSHFLTTALGLARLWQVQARARSGRLRDDSKLHRTPPPVRPSHLPARRARRFSQSPWILSLSCTRRNGDITIKLFPEKAPRTVENFLRGYAERGFYDQTFFTTSSRA